MSDSMWKKMEMLEGMPWHLSPDDACFYAREFISHGGWSASRSNQLIKNLKKPPSVEGTGQWHYKMLAVQQFANELAQLFSPDNHYAVALVPTSKTPDDADYDPRLDLALTRLRLLRPKIIVCKPISVTESHTPQHQSDERMSPDEVYELLQWDGFGEFVPNAIALIDDVITTGSHFKACKRLIQEHHKHIHVSGVFWAKTVWPEKADDNDDDEDQGE